MYFEKELEDFRFGKIVDWNGMKKRADQLSEIYEGIGLSSKDYDLQKRFLKKSDKVDGCNSHLLFGVKKNSEDSNSKKLVFSNNCRDRFCPICSFKKSRLKFYRLSSILNYSLKMYPNLSFIFATFTIRNVENDYKNFHSVIDNLSKSFSKMMRYSEILGKNGKYIKPSERIIKGYVRNIEVTYNCMKDEFHPHIHAIFAVDNSYFKRSSNQYITQAQWVKLWRKALGVNYDPLVSVEKVSSKKNRKNDNLVHSVLEVSKYETKTSEMISKLNFESAMKVCFTLNLGLKGIRSFVLSGIFKDINKVLFNDADLENADDKDLNNVDNSNTYNLSEYCFVLYSWNYKCQKYLRKNYLGFKYMKHIFDYYKINSKFLDNFKEDVAERR